MRANDGSSKRGKAQIQIGPTDNQKKGVENQDKVYTGRKKTSIQRSKGTTCVIYDGSCRKKRRVPGKEDKVKGSNSVALIRDKKMWNRGAQ